MSDTLLYDPLTGVYTRALLHDQLHAEVDRVRRYGHACSLLVFDLDHFKSVNDAFGHARGDQVLIEVARRVQHETRTSDQIFRYGGDEFVVLLPNTSKVEATRLARRLLDAIRDTPFSGDVPLSLSLSIGVATFPTDAADDQALFLKADERNYQAKRRGRAQVVAEDEQVAPSLPFADLSRLIERDGASETAQHFYADLVAQGRGALTVVGAAGTGRSRFLAEVEKRARLQGFTVIAIRGTRTLKSQPYGALAQVLPELLKAFVRVNLEAFVEALRQQLASTASARLLLSVDDLPDLDWGTLDLVRQLLASAAIPVLGLVYATDPDSERVAVPFSAAVSERVTLQPLSQTGLRIWLRVLMQWEPPVAFIDWLARQTGGRPAQVEQILHYLLKRGALTHSEGGWQLNQEYDLIGAAGARPGRRANPHNLPVALTSFIGREQERTEVRQLLATTRLLTLLGSGGMGKTRLSLEIATSVVDSFRDGVWFIELAPLSDTTLVLYTVGAVLGVREEQSRPLIATITDWLASKQLLFVLDNCEHLIDTCAHFADRVLRASPEVRILASSREPLDIGGELAYRVPSLDLPDPKQAIPTDQLANYAATRLFVERATFAQSTFRVTPATAPLIGEICNRLDGIPLAIELAAARTRTLSVEQIAARLDDRFRLLTGGSRTALPRHQTLRSLIDWSYSLLSEPERTLLRWLSVFTGGWTLDAAEALCQGTLANGSLSTTAGDMQPEDIASLLTQLVNKSLVVLDRGGAAPRYRMLETIRHYAHEQLIDAQESESVRDRHLNFYLHLAKQTEPMIMSAQRHGWVPRLELEHDNLRSALSWACERNLEMARWLAGAMGWFWYFGDHLNEGRAWYLRILALSKDDVPSPGLAKILCSAGMVASNAGYTDEPRLWLEQSIELCQALGEPSLLAEAVFSLAYTLVQVGQDERVCMLFEQHEAVLRASAPPMALGWALSYWGRALGNARGDYVTAKGYHDESVALGRAMQDPNILGTAFMNLGYWAAEQANYPEAYAYHAEALAWRRESGTRLHVAISSHNMADMLSIQGAYQGAQPLYTESLALSRTLGDQAFIAWTSYRLGYLATHQGLDEQAIIHFGESLKLYRAQTDQELITSCLAGCAELRRAQGQLEQAARILGYVAAHPQSAQRLFVYAVDRVEYEHTLNALQSQLDAASWNEGHILTLDQAIDCALWEASNPKGLDAHDEPLSGSDLSGFAL